MFFGRSRLWLLVALVLSVLGSFFHDQIDLYYADMLVISGINVVLAVSLNLINGHTGQFSLGHAGFMAVGAYAATAMTKFAGPSVLGEHAPHFAVLAWFGLALVVGGLVAAVAGVLVGTPSLRLRGDYLAIVTLGFGQIIAVILRNIPALGGALGLDQIPIYTDLGWVIAAAALTIYIVSALVHSTYGRGFLAVSDDEVAAEAMGVNTTRYKIVAFVVGAFFAGIGGGLDAHFVATINPKGYDFNRSIEIVAMVILGGMGNTRGVIAAAILLTFANYMLSSFQQFRPLLYAGLLIGMMLLRPQGLFTFGAKRKTQL